MTGSAGYRGLERRAGDRSAVELREAVKEAAREAARDGVRDGVREAVREGIREAFRPLGMDIDEPDTINEWHRRQQWLKDQIEADGDTKRSLKEATLYALAAAAVSGIVSFFTARLSVGDPPHH